MERKIFGGNDDDVRQYLNEIGRIPLLTRVEEVEHATIYRQGVNVEESLELEGRRPNLTERKQIAAGREAKDILINSNLRLVVSVAKKYRSDKHKLELLDLIQEGNTGLIRAVEKFDPDKGFKMSTYATWWIRQAITRGIADRGHLIRMPIHATEALHKLLKKEYEIKNSSRTKPLTDEELFKEMGLTREEMVKYNVMKNLRRDISLNSPLKFNNEENENELADILPDKKTLYETEDFAHNFTISNIVETLFQILNPREREVLILRHGLSGEEPLTLEQVGEKYNLTRERIRQIQAKANRKVIKYAFQELGINSVADIELLKPTEARTD